ncbi:MAG: Gfo/Idh/MocA family oxidoreductase [Phycisphaerae bacterium]
MKKKIGKGPITIGIVGLGRAGMGMHFPEIEKRKSRFKLVAACDPEEDFRNTLIEKCPDAKVYTNFEELLADPQVELVDIANRSTQHFEFTAKALKAGKDVFLEKPICVNFTEAKKLLDLSKKAKGKLYIRHNRRFEPAFHHIRQIIASGILGNVYEIKLCRHNYQRRDDWQTLMDCGGGQLLNWGPHIIDHGLRFIDGKLADLWSDLKLIAAVGDAEDHLKIILKGHSGRIVDIEISGGVAINGPVYTVYGTKGSLISENESTLRMRYIDPRQKLTIKKANPGTPKSGFSGTPETIKWIEKEIPVSPKPKVMMENIWDSLYESIRNGKKFPITLEDAVQTMHVVSMVKKGTPFEMKGKKR